MLLRPVQCLLVCTGYNTLLTYYTIQVTSLRENVTYLSGSYMWLRLLRNIKQRQDRLTVAGCGIRTYRFG